MIRPYDIFKIRDAEGFDLAALQLYQHHLNSNPVYARFCELLGKTDVGRVQDIPHLPISFFKSHDVITSGRQVEKVFYSSGTTGSTQSRHLLTDLELYQMSLDEGFNHFYGEYRDFAILALLPHYLEREGSSLVFMADRWIRKSGHLDSGFYLNDLDKLAKTLDRLNSISQPVILIGVTFALLDLADRHPMKLPFTTIIETGGMKGLRKELVREELHEKLGIAFAKAKIHSEYGMTELLSQAYLQGSGRFHAPPWMRVSCRDTNDPFSPARHGRTGGLNIMDLANYHSCPFIATQDLGRCHDDGSFEILGRFDHSDIRGCNLLAV